MGLFSTEVPARHRAVVYYRGAFRKVVDSDRNRKRPGDHFVMVDLREQLLTIAPQEVATADSVTVRVSGAVTWAVVDPQRYLEQVVDPYGALYLAAQIAMRDAVAPLTIEQIAGRTLTGSEGLTSAMAPSAEAIGVRAELVIRDVILPSALRAAALEVMTAKQRGAARLEEARAETAVLRSLANGARLLDASPALERLRLVQSAAYGSKLVLTVGDAD